MISVINIKYFIKSGTLHLLSFTKIFDLDIKIFLDVRGPTTAPNIRGGDGRPRVGSGGDPSLLQAVVPHRLLRPARPRLGRPGLGRAHALQSPRALQVISIFTIYI